MSELKVNFEFEIGEIVYCKDACHDQSHVPLKAVIVGRLAEECPGGVQKHYVLSRDNRRVLEHVLTREIPPYDFRVPEYIQEQAHHQTLMRKAERQSWREEADRAERAAKES